MESHIKKKERSPVMIRAHRTRQVGIILAFLMSCTTLLFLLPHPSRGADTYPNKPITYITPSEPGSKNDLFARALAPFLEKQLGVSLTLTNLPGASNKIGLTRLLKSKPDGYAIGQFPSTGIVCTENYEDDLGYSSKDFLPIYAWSKGNQCLVVNAQKYKNMDEFLKYARNNPVSAGIVGLGKGSHLAALVVAKELELKKVSYVPFLASPAITALAGNHVDFVTCTTDAAWPMVRAGKLRILVILSDEKDSMYPDIAVPSDLGLKMTAMPAIDGVAGPLGLSPDVVKVLETAVGKALKEPEFLAWAKNTQTTLMNVGSAEFKDLVAKQLEVVKSYRDLLREKPK
jgi:tripartite-type tricarboxylate transporter receptor subunit TctC